MSKQNRITDTENKMKVKDRRRLGKGMEKGEWD